MDGPQKWKILRLHVEDGIPLASLARDTGIGARTLSRSHAGTLPIEPAVLRLSSGHRAPTQVRGVLRLGWWPSWSIWH